jgi:predicted dehydrogenase
MIRYGLVGIGGYGAVWVRCLERLREQGIACVGAAVVRNPERYRDQVAHLHGQGCAISPDLDSMLAAGGIDLVGCPTGIATHAPLAIQALDAGYPVIVEKPLTAAIQDALAVQAAARRSGHWCAVAYQWLHSPTIQALADLLAEGSLGRIRVARSVIGWPRGQAYYTRNAWAGQLSMSQGWVLDGPATNATAHYLTNMLYLAGMRAGADLGIAAVRAELYHANEIPSYDTSCIEIELTDGARIYHYASHALRRSIEPQMHIVAEGGTIWWEASTDSATVTWADGTIRTIENPDMAWNQGRPFEQAARTVLDQDERPLCGLPEAMPQVLAINLAFESSGGVHSIRHLSQRTDVEGDPLVFAEGMEQVLARAMAEGGLFSDLGVPWAVTTEPYEANGYRQMPQGGALRRFLAS